MSLEYGMVSASPARFLCDSGPSVFAGDTVSQNICQTARGNALRFLESRDDTNASAFIATGNDIAFPYAMDQSVQVTAGRSNFNCAGTCPR